MHRPHSESPDQHPPRAKPFGGSPFKMLVMGLTLLSVAVTTLTAYAVAEIPFVVAAYNTASAKPDTSSVSATVTIKTVENTSGVKELIATGKLVRKGDLLVGVLPMTVDKPNVANEGTHALNLTVSKSGQVGVQWLVNNKPRDGRDVKYFETTVNGKTLVTTGKWWDARRDFTVAINRRLILRPLGPIVIIPKKTPKPFFVPGGVIIKPFRTPVARPTPFVPSAPTPRPKVAVGRTLHVKGRLFITNADDGFNDNTVEVMGNVNVNGKSLMSFNQSKHDLGSELGGKTLDFYYAYNSNDLTNVRIAGLIQDHDKTLSNDTMLIVNKYVNLREIADSGQEYLIKGDRNSESADLYLSVTKGDERFE